MPTPLFFRGHKIMNKDEDDEIHFDSRSKGTVQTQNEADMSYNIVLSYLEHGFHISHMKPQHVKVQKYNVNESFLVTIPYNVARAFMWARIR